ncbi:MAG: antibiotic biosynthesis monooxygenase [Actinomycetia bacterium]|nr:antibiotic biosynthesis monooxygenase [Actinomycetes bacterium]
MAASAVTKALLVRFDALPGREADVEDFLNQGLALVEQEPKTVRWFALRFGPSSFGIFDAFPDDEARQVHLNGAVGKALGENIGKLFKEPTIEAVDIVAEKVPQ